MEAIPRQRKRRQILRAAILVVWWLTWMASLQGQDLVAPPQPGSPTSSLTARVSLIDGTTLTGRVGLPVLEPVVTVATIDQAGRRTVDYVSSALVKEIAIVDPAPGSATDERPLVPPIEAVLTWTNGTPDLEGQVQQAGPGWVGVVPHGQQRLVLIPVAQLARMKLTESTGSAPAARPSPAPSASPGAPARMTVTLVDGACLCGDVAFDPVARVISVVATCEGRRRIDYVSASLVQTVAAAEPCTASTAVPTCQPPQSPLIATLRRVDGSTVSGRWQPSPAPGFCALQEPGATHPTLVALQGLARITLCEATASVGPAAAAP